MRTFALVQIVLVTLLAVCCAHAPARADAETSEERVRPKNLVLLIGDGMGPPQLGLLEEYARRAPNSPYGGGETTFSRLMREGVLGLSLTGTPDTLVVDSAASATQLASGEGAYTAAVGLDLDLQPVVTVIERASERGLGTGVVSDARITHATPAAFVAKVRSRHMENEIAEQLVTKRVDVLLGGGARHFIPPKANQNEALRSRLDRAGLDAIRSKRKDTRDLLAEAEAAGKQVVLQRDDLRSLGDAPVLGVFSERGMLDAIADRQTRAEPERKEPTLAELTSFSLERLSRNPNGFVLIVEAAQIDWAGHANDAGWMLAEMVKADEVVATIAQWMENRDDTLLVITGDHETGGFGFTYRSGPSGKQKLERRLDYGEPAMLDLLAAQTRSADTMTEHFLDADVRTPEVLASIVSDSTPLTFTLADARNVLDGYAVATLGEHERKQIRAKIMHVLAAQVNVVWSTENHTAMPIEVVAVGPGSEQFRGMLTHIEVGRRLNALLFSEQSQSTSP